MKKIVLLIIVIAAGYIIFSRLEKTDKDIDQVNSKTLLKNKTTSTLTRPSQLPPSVAVAKLPKANLKVRAEIPQTEQESLEFQTETLSRYVISDSGQEDLVEELTRLDLKPSQTKNTNSLGTSNIIRTEKSLKGTRYFHAQFKGDHEGNEVLQHMSFELRPGPESFSKAMKVISSKFDITSKLTVNQDDFKAWPLDNGYIVWVKKLTKKDLDDNPYNAYTEEDIGTIRVAVEIDIHPAGEHGDEEH